MPRNRLIFCVVFICVITGIACYGEEGYDFINFPPIKGKFSEVTAVQTYDWMSITTVGIIDANGYITEVKTLEDDVLMTTRKYTLTSTGKMKEKLFLYKDKVFRKEVYSYDKKDRLMEIQYSDTLNSKELKLSGTITYTYEGDTLKASFRRMDAAGKTLLLKGTTVFDEAGRIMAETEERQDEKTKEWSACTSTYVYDKKGYWIEFHYKCGDNNTIDSWWDIVFDKTSGLPLRYDWYPDKEKKKSTGEGVVFTYK